MVTTKTTEINWAGKPDYTVALAFRVETISKGSPYPQRTPYSIGYNKYKGAINHGRLAIVKHYKNSPKKELEAKEMSSRKESWHLS